MNCGSASANYGFTAKRISLDECTSVTASTSTEIQYKRTETPCSSAPGRREIRYGCPRPNWHSDVYASTFGTRRRSTGGNELTILHCSENGKCAGRSSSFCGRVSCNLGDQNVRKPPPLVDERPEKQQWCMDAACMATDEERRRRDIQPPLPYWHIATAAARVKQQESENQYNKERAAQAWDRYLAGVSSRPCEYGGQHLEPKDFGCYRRNAPNGGCPRWNQRGRSAQGRICEGERSRGMIYKCGGNVGDAPRAPGEDGECYEKSVHVYERSCKRRGRRHQSAPPGICRPFYGATELEKCSLNAINHLLKAEKELRRVHFTAGNILPQAKQYIEQVDAIHQDLKLFNTEFRELQKQTNEVLEQKGARHFHFVIQGSPTKYRPNAPLPSH
ncbi:hypothetical protein GCK32_009361 [Trichostrongylus colubriformis]|uniref:Uncharacterized protein n=1 Tax=Trichostrongylus colubriformis TaxID=6319 RepID=A0AAN8IQM7_TRICO